jgi:hypothetical protein
VRAAVEARCGWGTRAWRRRTSTWKRTWN